MQERVGSWKELVFVAHKASSKQANREGLDEADENEEAQRCSLA